MGRRLYVGNLPYKATDEELTALFSTVGDVASARVMRDMATGRARGFGFIEMASDEAAQKAMGLADGKVHNNIQQYGNTTSATLPLCFHEARQAGKAPEGALVAFAALGAGLHWGAVLLQL